MVESNFVGADRGRTHLSLELLRKRGGNVNLLHVPYKGGAPAMQDLLDGQYVNRMPVNGIRLGNRVVRPAGAQSSAQHGFAHRAAQLFAECSDHPVEMRLAADAGSGEQPWPLSARQRRTLSSLGLQVEIEARNEEAQSMPLAMGWHPYFAVASTATSAAVSFVARSRFEIDAVGSAVPSDRAASSFGMERGETAAFPGWKGAVQLQTQSGLRVAMHSKGADCLVLHRPYAGDYLCAEPVTALPGNLLIRHQPT